MQPKSDLQHMVCESDIEELQLLALSGGGHGFFVGHLDYLGLKPYPHAQISRSLDYHSSLDYFACMPHPTSPPSATLLHLHLISSKMNTLPHILPTQPYTPPPLNP